MLSLLVATLQAQVVWSPPLPRAPPPPPPFSHDVQIAAERLASRVSDEFKFCGHARARSNARSVEAFGTARYSAKWNTAAVAMKSALTVCQGQRQALRAQQDFLIGVVQNGTRDDADLAVAQLGTVAYELEGIEQFFVSEAPRYRELLTTGWGNPHCADHADGYLPPSSICPSGVGASHR